jgi:hypothetical protein
MQKQQDYTWVLVIGLLALVFLSGDLGGGGSPSPTKALPKVPSVLVLYDSDPAATVALNTSHKGQSDVITSIHPDSAKIAVTKAAKGVWLTYGTKEPAPDPSEGMAGLWASQAYEVAKAGGKLPWMVVSTPDGKGYSGPVPDPGNDIAAAQEATKKILSPLLK